MKNWFTLEDAQQAHGTYHAYLFQLLQIYLKRSSRTSISSVLLLLMPVNNNFLNLTTDTCKIWNVPSIVKLQSNTTFNICIAKRCLYIACLNNYMFRPLYRPLSGCTFSYYKANYTVHHTTPPPPKITTSNFFTVFTFYIRITF